MSTRLLCVQRTAVGKILLSKKYLAFTGTSKSHSFASEVVLSSRPEDYLRDIDLPAQWCAQAFCFAHFFPSLYHVFQGLAFSRIYTGDNHGLHKTHPQPVSSLLVRQLLGARRNSGIGVAMVDSQPQSKP